MPSHWFAWISFGFSILLLLKFAARKAKLKKLNRIFSRLHRPFAIIMFASGLVHGIISLIKSTNHIAALVSGILLLGCAVYVCLTCMHRHHHRKTWMKMHRIGSVVLAVLLAAHLLFALVI